MKTKQINKISNQIINCLIISHRINIKSIIRNSFVINLDDIKI